MWQIWAQTGDAGVWKTYIAISKSNQAWNFEVVHAIKLGKKHMKKSLLHETWSKTKCYVWISDPSHIFIPPQNEKDLQ